MKIKVLRIADKGVPDLERLHLSVLADANLVNYAVFDTVKLTNGTAIQSIPKHTYWFLSYPVKAGDDVVLYTRPGVQSKAVRGGGGTTHFFFWGMTHTLWDAPDACAVVLEVVDWATSP
jgi:hypothetical protein